MSQQTLLLPRSVAGHLLPLLLVAAASTARADDPPKAEPPLAPDHFTFGSYGRFQLGSDLEGGTGRQVRLVARPPRLLEGPYAEIDLGYDQATGEAKFHSQVTLAVAQKLAHFTGRFDDNPIAVRNLYLEVRDVVPGLALWAGSRMVRGDDIYLLDTWPLDEQNAVGGGASWNAGNTSVRAHVGMNRLDDAYQTQTIQVAADPIGTRPVLLLDRLRVLGAGRVEHRVPAGGGLHVKGVVYLEAHGIGQGSRRRDDGTREALPGDNGWVAGAELGAWGFGPHSFANLFFRHGEGLGAYNTLAVPYGLGTDKTASSAREWSLGLSANHETHAFGVNVGALVRYFVDADPNVYDRNDVWEFSGAVRPAWFITDVVHLLAEANLQYQRPNGLSPETLAQETPLAFQFALMPAVSLGRGSYARPQLRVVYAATLVNRSARLTYAPEDEWRLRKVQQFLGVALEWWFHSSRY